MHKSLLIVSFLCFILVTQAQQEPKMDMFWNNYMHTNPAMTGLNFKRFVGAQYRHQWSAFSSNPQIATLDYAERIAKIHGGAGVSYEFDKIGFDQYSTFLATYAFHLPTEKGVFSFGLSAGIKQIYTRPVWNFPQSQIDPSLPEGNKEIKPQLDFGLAFKGELLTIGLSSTQLNAARYATIGYSQVRHYWLNFEYRYSLADNFTLLPRLQIVTDINKLSSTQSIIVEYKEKCYVGITMDNISYSSQNSLIQLGPTVGYVIADTWNIGYTWNIVVNGNFPGVGNLNTHEFILSYQLK